MKKNVVDVMMENESYATRAEADRAFEHVVEGIRTVVGRGDEVRIQNFGTLKKKHKPERNGRNPRTGESVRIAARDVVTFKPYKSAN